MELEIFTFNHLSKTEANFEFSARSMNTMTMTTMMFWFLIRAVEMISLSHFLSLLFSVLNLAKTKPKAALADGFDQFLFRLFLTDVFRHAQGEETRLGHG